MKERIIHASDDESEGFDEFNEGGDMTSSADEVISDGSQSQYQYQDAHLQGDFEEVMDKSLTFSSRPNQFIDGIEMTDLTGNHSLSAVETSIAKRNRTTMERLGYVSYHNTGAYGNTISTDHRFHAAAVPVANDPSGSGNSSTLEDQPTNKHVLAKSIQWKSSQKSTSILGEPIPSSREIFPVGSTNLQGAISPEQSFRTQTTIPFTMPEATLGSPMVVIPTGELVSSGVLAGNIDEISNFLQRDIANSEVTRAPVVDELPSTDPMPTPRNLLQPERTDTSDSSKHVRIERHPEEPEQPEQPGEKPKQPQKIVKRSQEDKESTQILSKIPYPDAHEPWKSRDDDSDVPEENYKPRPTRSRNKRSANDSDSLTNMGSSNGLKNSERQAKRRKTEDDILDDSIGSRPPNKKERKSRTIQSGEEGDSNAVAQTLQAENDDQEKSREDHDDEDGTIIVKSVDELQGIQPKKKRGRPKKSQRKSKSDEDGAAQEDSIHCKENSDEEPVMKQVSSAHATSASKNGTRQSSKKARPNLIVLDDSEDELAGGEPTKSRLEKEESQQSNSNETPVEKPGKRGRKAKKPKASPEETRITEEESTEPLVEQNRDDREETSRGTSESTRVARPPLQDKREAINTPIVAPELETQAKPEQESPEEKETPQTPRTPQDPQTPSSETSLARIGSIPTGKVPYRIGLSKRTRIAPLLKIIRKK